MDSQTKALTEKDHRAALEARVLQFLKQEAEEAGRVPPRSITVPMLKARLHVKNGLKHELVRKLM